MKKLGLLLTAVLALPTLAHANDTSVAGIGGRWKIVQKEHPSIRMVRERIDLTLDKKGFYTTVAEFIFHNSGPATQVQMGFPETGYGDIDSNAYKNKSSFTNFKTWVDGTPFSAKRQLTSSGEGSFDALWVKTVPFRRNQTRRVQVSYQSNWGSTSSFPSDFVTYDFTGGNWQGTVESSVLTVHLNIPGTYLVSTDQFEKAKPQFVRQGHDFIYTWRNWQAQQAFAFRFDTTLRNWLGGSNVGEGATEGLPVNIDAPNSKIDESQVGYVPRGVVRGGETFINLRYWLDWAQEQKLLTSSYDAKTKKLIVRRGGVSQPIPINSRAHSPSFSVKDLGETPRLFVPASLLVQECSARFNVNLKTHSIQFLK